MHAYYKEADISVFWPGKYFNLSLQKKGKKILKISSKTLIASEGKV